MKGIIRQATMADLDGAEALYEAHFDGEERDGKHFSQWKRGEYPCRQTAEESIAAGTFFVYEEAGRILASMRVNHEQPDSYKEISWAYPARDEEVLVIHTLVVHPQAKGQGIGPQMIAYGCEYGREKLGCKVFRFDTNSQNLPAVALYQRLGYRLAGTVNTLFEGCIPCTLNCYEREL